MNTEPNLFDICERKHGGNAESVEAFESIKHSLSERRQMVLAFIKRVGGATPDEVAEYFTRTVGGTQNSWAPRCSELKELGLVYPSNERRLTRQGKFARVLRTI